MIFGGLLWHIEPVNLLDSAAEDGHYLRYLWAVVPFCLASFGYHGNIAGLVSYYRKNAGRVSRCLIYGTLLALAIYLVWIVGTMGNIPRQDFKAIAAQGGNIDVLVAALSGVLASYQLSFEDGSKMTGQFLVQKLDYSGDYNGERSYTISLESSGAVVPA